MRKSIAVVMTLVFVLILGGCGQPSGSSVPAAQQPANQPAAPAAGDTVKIGVPLTLTGGAAFAGTKERKGMELAEEEINNTGFLGATKLKLLVEDDAGNKEQAVTLVKKFINQDQVNVIAGMTLSGNTLAVVPLAQQGKVPFIVVESGVAGVVETGDYIFRINIPQPLYFPKTVDALAAKGVKTAAILWEQDNPSIAAWIPQFEKLLADKNIKMLLQEKALGKDTDFTAQLTKIQGAKPDAIGIILSGQNATAVTQARQMGIKSHIFGQAAYSSPTFLNATKGFSDGAVLATGFHASMAFQESKDFTEKYRKKFNEDPDQYAAEGYDGVWWLARAIKKQGKSDREAIKAGLAGISEMNGAMGPLTFVGRDVRGQGVAVEIKDGKLVPVSK